MFDDAHWNLYQAHTYREATSQLSRDWAPVIICERQLPDGNWKDVLSQTVPLAERPRLIVISSQANEHLWSEVLALGGHDLLGTPLKETEVAYVVGSAWLEWNNTHERANRHAVMTVSR
jgi:DNA-binding NtrC family response regulator